MQLDALLKQPQALPTVPAIVAELIDSFSQEEVSIDALVQKIALDPVLSARVLRLANSAYYHVSRSIGTVDDALVMLGFVTVRTLVISSGLTSAYKSLPGIDLPRFWRHSLHTAAVAAWIASRVGVNRDQAFTVGLMHALGELVMHAGMPERMAELDRVTSPMDPLRLDIEANALGYHHADVGAELARQWHFPETFCNALARYPAPLSAASFDPAAGVLHLACWRTRGDYLGWRADQLADTLSLEVCQALGLDAAVLLVEMPPPAELSSGLDALLG